MIEDSNPENHKQILEAELKEIIHGNVLFYSINEVKQRLDKVSSNMRVS